MSSIYIVPTLPSCRWVLGNRTQKTATFATLSAHGRQSVLSQQCPPSTAVDVDAPKTHQQIHQQIHRQIHRHLVTGGMYAEHPQVCPDRRRTVEATDMPPAGHPKSTVESVWILPISAYVADVVEPNLGNHTMAQKRSRCWWHVRCKCRQWFRWKLKTSPDQLQWRLWRECWLPVLLILSAYCEERQVRRHCMHVWYWEPGCSFARACQIHNSAA